jgi:hypothetical protein
VKFYKELIKFYPDFQNDLLTSENICGRLFEGKPFHKQTMWNLNSGLEKLAEEFLVHLALIKRPREKFNLIRDELDLRRLDKHYIKMLHEMEKIMENSKVDTDYFYYLRNLQEYKMIYWQKLKGLDSRYDKNVFEVAEKYILDYLVNIRRILYNFRDLKFSKNLNLPYNAADDFLRNTDFKKIIEISKKKNYKYADLIEFYCNTILWGLNEDEDCFYKIKSFLFKNHKLFDRVEKKNLVSTIANICGHKYQFGDKKFAKELFEINKFRLKNNLATYDNGKINKELYKQIVYNALSLNEIRWTEKFIENYTPLLFDEYQVSIKNLAKAYVYFKTKRYDDVLDCLKKFKYADAVDKVSVKNLIARTYYEMKEYELLLYHIDSTKHFLRKNKSLGIEYREIMGNFFNYLYWMVIAIEKNDKNRIIKLEEKIKGENKVNNKIWLLEKLSEIKFD